MEKITKRQYFEAIKTMFETGTCDYDAETMIAFCDKEVVALDTKAAKAKERAAAKKAEADVLTDYVRAALTDEFKTIADIAAIVAETDPDATVHKVTNRLTRLVNEDFAEKTQVTIPGVDGAKARKVQAYKVKA